MKQVKDIIKSGLCLGCGLCEAIVGADKCKMKITAEGFYQPEFEGEISEADNRMIMSCCPSINVRSGGQSGVWGNIIDVTESWATDSVLRKKSATGGVISALAIYLLESKRVDAILQIGVKEGSWLHNELLISRTKDDVFKNAQSRYAPALVFDRIKEILDGSTEVFGFIGKPCDIAGIKNFLELHQEYKNRIKYTLAIFCAGIPSYNATKDLVTQANNPNNPHFLKYRGDGWPGEFEIRFPDGQSFKASYNDSWGQVLGRTLGIRCKICPDGIGMLADISTGDSWNTKDGYPDFTEADGRNFVFVRTRNGEDLYKGAVQEGVISHSKLDIRSIKDMHKYQYFRRLYSGWRVMALQILTRRLLRFSGLGLNKIMFELSVKSGIKEFLGTVRRFRHLMR